MANAKRSGVDRGFRPIKEVVASRGEAPALPGFSKERKTTMSSEPIVENVDGSTAKRTRSRSTIRVDARSTGSPVAKKTKMSFSLDDSTAKRLAIHAAMTGVDRAEIVSRLINDNLKSYRVQTINGNESAPDVSEAGKRLSVA